MLCDASSLPITNTFTYDAIRNKNCNVIVCFSLTEDEYEQKGWKKPAYVYPHNKIDSKQVRKTAILGLRILAFNSTGSLEPENLFSELRILARIPKWRK